MVVRTTNSYYVELLLLWYSHTVCVFTDTVHIHTRIYKKWVTCNVKNIRIEKSYEMTLGYAFWLINQENGPSWVVEWIECQPVNQSVASSIPSQGTCLGCGARSPVSGTWEATTHWCFSPSFSPSLTLCLKNK